MADALMVSSSFLPGTGGIESYLAELCDELAPRLAVLAAAERDGRPIPSDLPYPTTGYPRPMLWPGRSVAQAIAAAAAAAGTDRVLFGTPWPLVLAGPALARRGLRYAAIVHGAEFVLPAALPVVGDRLARAMGGADLLLPVSDYTARRVQRKLDAAGVSCPPMALLRARVDVDRFHPDVDTAAVRGRLGLEERRTILCFGRLVKRKGVDLLLEALPEIARRVPDVIVVIGGTGPQEGALRRRAEGIEPGRVVFAGRVPEDAAPALFAAADLFCLPVFDRWGGLEIEGLGVVLLEASAAGSPCVTGRSGGTPEAVVDGETGFVVDARDRSELVERICELLTDPARAERMGQAARGHVTRSFARRPLPSELLQWMAPTSPTG
ncbi:MAG: glycosyltransferase family 4 protein [Actinomycetota bacterium]|nr:glycosyltransferase family 4 protein [Actinomycetota bacterium]